MAPTPPVEAEGVATALPFLTIFALASLGIGLGVHLHTRAVSMLARALLWLSTTALLIAALAHLSLGVYFLPGGAPAVLTSLAAVVPGWHPAPIAVPSV